MAADTLPTTGGRPEPPSSSSSSGPSQAMAAPAAVAVSGAESADSDDPQLDANKLHCYQVALELHTQCSVLVGVLHRVVRD